VSALRQQAALLVINPAAAADATSALYINEDDEKLKEWSLPTARRPSTSKSPSPHCPLLISLHLGLGRCIQSR